MSIVVCQSWAGAGAAEGAGNPGGQGESGGSGWRARATSSVRAWAAARGHDYRVRGDDLFDLLPPGLLQRIGGRTAMAADLARLAWLQAELAAGAEAAFWFDADCLVFASGKLAPDLAPGCRFGLEYWVQRDARGRLQARRNVHNAFLGFRRGDPTLAFYRATAERLLSEAALGRVPAQFVGPKLLTALDGAVGLPLEPAAGAASPLVLRDIAVGDGPALRRLRARQPGLAAVNLGASLLGRTVDGVALDDALLEGAVDRLLALERL